ncbi:MAG: TrmH family RNA methyltransferase [Bernardetiaceae bacterium]
MDTSPDPPNHVASGALSPLEVALSHFLEDYLTDHKRELFAEKIAWRTGYVRVVLEDLYHSHNVSAILRSCECFGVQYIHALTDGDHNAQHFHPKVMRGAAKWLSVQTHTSYTDCRQALRQSGIRTVALSPHATQTLDAIDLSQPVALVFGREWEGLSDHITTDETVKIPMYGFTESFNISVAVALCLHALVPRLHQQPPQTWQLSTDEQARVHLQWLRQAIQHSGPLEAHFRSRWAIRS